MPVLGADPGVVRLGEVRAAEGRPVPRRERGQDLPPRAPRRRGVHGDAEPGGEQGLARRLGRPAPGGVARPRPDLEKHGERA